MCIPFKTYRYLHSHVRKKKVTLIFSKLTILLIFPYPLTNRNKVKNNNYKIDNLNNYFCIVHAIQTMLYYSFIEFTIIYSVYFTSQYLFGGEKKTWYCVYKP